MKQPSSDSSLNALLTFENSVNNPILSWDPINRLGSGVNLTFSFMNFIPSSINEAGFERMNADQKDAVRDVMSMIETYANVQFTEIFSAGNADINFGTADLGATSSGTVGIAYSSYFISGGSHGYYASSDVFLTNGNSLAEYSDPTPDTFAYSVLIHEVGHALGLEHPFEGRALNYIEDTTEYTVMSYTDGFSEPEEPRTLMPLDILALQYLYGENTAINAGDTTYDLTSYDANSIQTLWDASGTDTLTIAGATTAGSAFVGGLSNVHKVDLATFVDVGAKLYFAPGIEIENLTGSAFADVLKGNGLGNVILGGDADDWIELRGGNDAGYGGLGSDMLINSAGDDSLFGGAGNDVAVAYTGNNEIVGEGGGDTLLGGTGDDILDGGSGNDILIGDFASRFYAGDDQLTAGAGIDKLMGGGGADRFIFGTNDGANTIASYDDVSMTIQESDFDVYFDTIVLNGFGYASGAQALNDVSDVGGHATFKHADFATTITFYGLISSDLTAAVFEV